ncbi:MAG: SDR family oxidoreductase [Candidatus Sungbacteria bacterium]|uniref:SDR family oxidoreductase n=1 Tax=Candidatus Sungiibacteriota bacterium TaxID=2750080 RepID=A0A9D6LMI0_9BACT|nr:SDR family oxidoreductase [Candidatus Sungbacteria bacterium]
MPNKTTSALFDLTAEVAIVTGGQGQLGSEYVKTLAGAGASVAIFDIAPRVRDSNQNLIDQKWPVSTHVVDILEKDQIAGAFDAVEKTFGTPTILINNAGLDSPPDASEKDNGPFETYPESSWDAVVNSHIKGAFLMSQEFIGRAKKAKKKASIINVSSTYGLVSPDQSIYEFRRKNGASFYKPVAYSVAKSGILNLTRWLAEYGGPFGIRVNTLVPGGVFANQDKEFIKEYSRRTMIGRMANVDEYNGAILFLASAKASAYMTGSMLVIDGGWTAK